MTETETTTETTQTYPFPVELVRLVDACVYRPGWQVYLEERNRGQGSVGLTLIIVTLGYDSYNVELGQTYQVNHFFPVPPAAYDRRSWQRWLFDQFALVEVHEAMEFFKIDGKNPYAPMHGPGNNPYMITEERTDVDRRTKFTGEVNPPEDDK